MSASGRDDHTRDSRDSGDGIDLGLAGKVALVTGSGAGIGRGIARWLARAGCRLAVNDIDAAKAEETVVGIRAAGGEAKAFVANVRNEQAVGELIAAIQREFGGLDVAVNNVGMNAGMPATPFIEWRGADFEAVVGQNLIATALCCIAEARAMVEQGRGGVILNVTSGETTRPAIRLRRRPERTHRSPRRSSRSTRASSSPASRTTRMRRGRSRSPSTRPSRTTKTPTSGNADRLAASV